MHTYALGFETCLPIVDHHYFLVTEGLSFGDKIRF